MRSCSSELRGWVPKSSSFRITKSNCWVRSVLVSSKLEICESS